MKQKFDDGNYTAEVILSGGSGRASIKSPADIQISDGEITAEIVWSSPNYDYMEVEGTTYYPVNSKGNSTFIIAVPALDSDIPMLAETVAMSEPHIIEYTIKFNSSTIKSTDNPAGIFIYFSAAAVLAISVLAVVFAAKRKIK
ncbi:MAG: hypothetical protein NC395_03305 [Prevotella sp.]|nr:hypothetical protein [Prevotella sp.]